MSNKNKKEKETKNREKWKKFKRRTRHNRIRVLLSKSWSYRAWNYHWKILKCWALQYFLLRIPEATWHINMTVRRSLCIFCRRTNWDTSVPLNLELTIAFPLLSLSPQCSSPFFTSSPTSLLSVIDSRGSIRPLHTFSSSLVCWYYSELEYFNLNRSHRFAVPTLLFKPFWSHVTFTVSVGSGYPVDAPLLGQLAHPGLPSQRGAEQVLVQGREVIPTEKTLKNLACGWLNTPLQVWGRSLYKSPGRW